MSNGGWVKVHRSLLDHWISQDFWILGLWVWLIGRANWEPKKWLYRRHLYELQRGECMISIADQAEHFGVSRKALTGALDLLEREHQIVQEKSKRGTKITIVNYSKYQCNDSDDGTTEGTSEGTSEEHQKSIKGNTIKNYKNNKKYTNTECDPSKHPSPKAPKHLKRKSEELLPYPTEDGPVYLTADEYEALKERWSEAETNYIIRLVARWSTENPTKFRKRVDHALTCIAFRDKALGDGKIFFNHPVHGPNYYKSYQVEQWQQHQ